MVWIFKASLLLLLGGSLVSPAVGTSSPSSNSSTSVNKPDWRQNNTKWQFSGDDEEIPTVNENSVMFPTNNMWLMHAQILAFVMGQIANQQAVLIKVVPSPCNRFAASKAEWDAMLDSFYRNGRQLFKSEYLNALRALRSAAVAVRTCSFLVPEWLIGIQEPVVKLAMNNIILTGLIIDACGYDTMPNYMVDVPMDTIHELFNISSWNISQPLRSNWRGQQL